MNTSLTLRAAARALFPAVLAEQNGDLYAGIYEAVSRAIPDDPNWLAALIQEDDDAATAALTRGLIPYFADQLLEEVCPGALRKSERVA